MNIKKGDIVTMRAGDDKGKTAKVIRAFPREGKVLVEGVNVVKKHQKPRQQGKKGEVVDVPMPVSVSIVEKSDKPAKAAKPAKK